MAARSFLLCLVAATSSQASFARLSRQANNSQSGYDFVDPLIGTRNGGKLSVTDLFYTVQLLINITRPCLRGSDFTLW